MVIIKNANSMICNISKNSKTEIVMIHTLLTLYTLNFSVIKKLEVYR
jgi:hypothetical protein